MNKHAELVEELAGTFGGMKRVIMQSRDQILGELHLSRTQIEIIMLLSVRDGQAIGELAAALAVTNSASTQTVETLVKRGLLDRRSSPDDRRVAHVFLTPKAVELAEQLHASRRQRMTQACAELSDEELTLMISVLKRLAKQFESNPANNSLQEAPHANGHH